MLNSQMQSLAPNLMVRDVEASIKFYKELLGFELIMSIPGESGLNWAMLKRDDVMIMLHEHNSMNQEYACFSQTEVGASVVFYIKVSDVNALYEQVSQMLTVEKELHTTFYNMHEFTIKDNNGYVITFAEPAE